jgi:hypothetical protein
MYVQSANGGSYENERAWVKFDLSGQVPAGATITSAKLRLYCWRAGSADMDAAVHSASDDSWTETGITWSNQPSIGPALDTVTLAAGQTALWYEWDVTAFVTAEAAGDETVSLLVGPVVEDSATYLTYAFDSKEYSGGTLAPVLEIQWDDGSGDPEPDNVTFYYRHAPDGLLWSAWTGVGSDTVSGDGWSQTFTYPQGQGYYEFYTISTDGDGNLEEAPVRADARLLFNNPPPEPTAPSIPDGAVDVGSTPTLSISVSDPDGGPVDVYFYNGATEALIGAELGVTSGSSAAVIWSGLAANTTYSWYVVVDDGLGTTRSATWTFTTQVATPASVPAASPVGLALTVLALVWLGICQRPKLKP